uniref:Uncharacterized protein n=1 Tax=Arundo donax TaxID=35708 RepID=A0A0A9C3P8_ARUDO
MATNSFFKKKEKLTVDYLFRSAYCACQLGIPANIKIPVIASSMRLQLQTKEPTSKSSILN